MQDRPSVSTTCSFPNKEMSELTRDGTGEFIGTFNEEILVKVEIVKPDEKELNQLVFSKLESIGVLWAVYTFVVTPPLEELPKRALGRLQKEYVILGWDSEQWRQRRTFR